MAGYERFLSVWKYRDTRVGILQESKREEAKIGKVEWQDMKDSYLVWKYRDTRVGILPRKQERQR